MYDALHLRDLVWYAGVSPSNGIYCSTNAFSTLLSHEAQPYPLVKPWYNMLLQQVHLQNNCR